MNKEVKEREKYSLDDFKEIIKVLRSEHGCPWDRAQTHGSLTGCMIEEAAEAVSAIKVYEKTGNKECMQEELGDVLMQGSAARPDRRGGRAFYTGGCYRRDQ